MTMHHRIVAVPLFDRFWAKVGWVDDPTECWRWRGSTIKQGYGTIPAEPPRTKNLRAHRLMWFYARGQIPDGFDVLHHCDNPPCVNPNHLFIGTDADNSRDAWSKGRNIIQTDPSRVRRRGEAHKLAKLTDKAVLQIRALHGKIPSKELAARFGVSPQLISMVASNKVWRHVVGVVKP